MILEITLVLASVVGVIYSLVNKNSFLGILSSVVLITTIAIGMLFSTNPY
ncbi:MAG: hypothetical protein WBI17_10580 [Clostridiaceae bacterium]